MASAQIMEVTTTIVVPVYNEQRRLRTSAFTDFVAKNPNVRILFANDGSTDGTKDILEQLCRHPSGQLTYLDLAQNSGKAEAVRTGIAAALADPRNQYVGYLDADLSTPVSEIPEFIKILNERPHVTMVLGSRVKLLGRLIKRRAVRHYVGRVFATVASIVLRIGVYDTQCGAKLLRVSPQTKSIFASPFSSRWIFDVEIIARLARETRCSGDRLAAIMVEYPLSEWQEVRGSKLKPLDFVVAFLEMVSIYTRYHRDLKQ